MKINGENFSSLLMFSEIRRLATEMATHLVEKRLELLEEALKNLKWKSIYLSSEKIKLIENDFELMHAKQDLIKLQALHEKENDEDIGPKIFEIEKKIQDLIDEKPLIKNNFDSVLNEWLETKKQTLEIIERFQKYIENE